MILQRYVLKDLVVTFLFAFSVVMFVCLVGMILQSMQSYAGVSFDILAELVPTALAYIAPWSLVIAICVSTTLVYARLSADNELDAMLSLGIHPLRIFAPGILFAAVLCLPAYLIYEEGAPRAHYRRRFVVRDATLYLLQSPPPGNQSFKLGRYILSYAGVDGGTLEHPWLTDLSDPANPCDYQAESGRFQLKDKDQPTLHLENVMVERHEPGGMTDWLRGEGKIEVSVVLETVADYPKGPRDMTRSELMDYRVNGKDEDWRKWAEAEHRMREARAFSPIFLVLACVPLGILTRKHSRLAGLGVSLGPIVIHVVCSLVGDAMGESYRLHPVVAGWMANTALFFFALPMTLRVFRR